MTPMGIKYPLYSIIVCDAYLIYSPLQKAVALINNSARQELVASLTEPFLFHDSPLAYLFEQKTDMPSQREGPLDSPLFLGLIPTRNCNMACRYCDFGASIGLTKVMSTSLGRQSIDCYYRLLMDNHRQEAEIHFFGGEPFYAEMLVHSLVEYARIQAQEYGLTVGFEATTNGLFNPSRCSWIADHFDKIVLSLDGTPDIQDFHRPAHNNRPTSSIVIRNAYALSESAVDLTIRACVTQQTVLRLPEIATWIGNEFRPSAVCFESLHPSDECAASGLLPPDPWDFALNFDRASRILAEYGIDTVLSTADTRSVRVSFCPVGNDALLVSPDGAINACYLLENDWRRQGLNLRLGQLEHGQMSITDEALNHVRSLTVQKKRLCANCFCRFHCAGGCHVNHDTSGLPGRYDTLCIQTRLVTLIGLMRQLGQEARLDTWLNDRLAMEESVWQGSDCLELRTACS